MASIYVFKKNSNGKLIFSKDKNLNTSIKSKETLTYIGEMNPDTVMLYNSNKDNCNVVLIKRDIVFTYDKARKMCINCNEMNPSIHIYIVNSRGIGFSNGSLIFSIEKNPNFPIKSNETVTYIGEMNPGKVMLYDIISNEDLTGFNYFEVCDNFVFEEKDIVVTYDEACKNV
jgi:hypothetical protein